MTSKTKQRATTAPAVPLAKSPSKSALVLKLLSRTKGATIAEIGAQAGWQPHSTRAFVSGLRTKGRSIVREQRKTGETVYRIVDAANPLVAAVPAPVTGASPPLSDLSEADKSPFDVASGGEQVDGNAGVEADAYLSRLRTKGMTVTRDQRKSGETAYRVSAGAAAVDVDVYAAVSANAGAISSAAAEPAAE